MPAQEIIANATGDLRMRAHRMSARYRGQRHSGLCAVCAGHAEALNGRLSFCAPTYTGTQIAWPDARSRRVDAWASHKWPTYGVNRRAV